MNKIIKHELKRQLNTKGTKIIILIALLLTAFLAYLPARMESLDIVQPDGSIKTLKNVQAIKQLHELEKEIQGEVTSEKMLQVFERYKKVYEKYNGELSMSIYRTELRQFGDIRNTLYYAFPDLFGSTSMPYELYNLTSEDILSFYERRSANQQDYFVKDAMLSGSALESAQNMESQVHKPFYYVSSHGWDMALEYVGMAAKLIGFLVCIIAAQIFSNSYKSGEDEILRCTKFGRKKFAGAKILSTLILTACLYITCILITFVIQSITLGTEGLKTSIQFIDPLSPAPFTYGDIWLQCVVYGLISILAMASLVLFISSISKASVFVMALSAPLILLPLLMRFIFKTSQPLLVLISEILPTSGMNIYYSLIGGTGSLTFYGSIWSPYVTGIAALIAILVFALLGVRSYSKHEVI